MRARGSLSYSTPLSSTSSTLAAVLHWNIGTTYHLCMECNDARAGGQPTKLKRSPSCPTTVPAGRCRKESNRAKLPIGVLRSWDPSLVSLRSELDATRKSGQRPQETARIRTRDLLHFRGLYSFCWLFAFSFFAPPKHSTHRLACRCKSSEIRCLKCFLINYDGCLNLGMIRIRNMSFKKWPHLILRFASGTSMALSPIPILGNYHMSNTCCQGFCLG